MGARASDWSALGLHEDPTPGDPDQVQELFTFLDDVATSTDTINTALKRILGTATTGNFQGLTADALHQQLVPRFIKFMDQADTSFDAARDATSVYLAAMRTQQATADGLLAKAQASGLKPDDPQITSWASQATQAGTDLTAASNTAGHAIDAVAHSYNPLTPAQQFWQIFTWIAIALMIPAILFGGAFGLIAFAANLALFIKAAVDFAHGEIGFVQFLLAFLGILAPSTRALPIADLLSATLKGLGDLTKSGVNFFKGSFGDLMHLLQSTDVTQLLSVDSLIGLGRFTLTAGIWVFDGLKSMPVAIADAAKTLGSKFGAFLTTTAETFVLDLKTGGWLKLVLPVSGEETRELGLLDSLKLGFLHRGLGYSNDPVLDLWVINRESFKGVGTGLVKPWSYSSQQHAALNRPAPGLRLSPLGTDGRPLVTPLSTLGHLPGNRNFSVDPLLANPHLGSFNTSLSVPSAIRLPEPGSISGLSRITPSPTGFSHLAPASFPRPNLDVANLAAPPELRNLVDGSSVLTHASDLSVVTHKIDTVEMPAGLGRLGEVHLSAGIALNSPAHLASTGLSHLDLATGSLPRVDLAGAALPHLDLADGHLATGHLATAGLGPLGRVDMHLALPSPAAVPELRHLADGSSVVTHVSDLSVVAHKIDTVEMSAGLGRLSEVHLSAGIGLNFPAHLAPASLPHAALPHSALPHAALPETRLAGPAVSVHAASHVPDLSFAAHPVEIKNLLANPADAEIRLPGTTVSAHLNPLGKVPAAAPRLELNHGQSVAALNAHGGLPHLNGGAGPGIDAVEQPAWSANAGFEHLAAPAGFHQAGSAQLAQVTPEISHPLSGGLHGSSPGLHGPSPDLRPDSPAVSSSAADTHADLAGDPGSLHSPDLAGTPGLLGRQDGRVAVPWTDFKVVQADYTSALNHFHQSRPGPDASGAESSAAVSSFKGKEVQTPGQAAAEHGLQMAGGRLNAAADALHQFGTDAPGLTAAEYAALAHSLLEHPRAVGGSRLGDRVVTAKPDGTPAVATRGLGPNHQLNLDLTGAAEHGTLIDVRTGLQVDSGVLTEAVAHPGFRLTNPADPHVFHEYQADATLHAQGMTITDHQGVGLGHVEVDHNGGGAVHTDPAGVDTHLTAEKSPGGGVKLTNQADSTWQRFDAGGRLVGQSLAGLSHDGKTALGPIEIDYTTGRASTGGTGASHADWRYSPRPGAGFRLDHPTDGTWRDFSATAKLTGQKLDVTDHQGVALGLLQIDHVGGGAIRTDPAGVDTHLAGTTLPSGEFKVTDAAAGNWQRFNQAGRLTGAYRGALNHDGTALTHVEIDYAAGHAFTDGIGTARPRWTFRPDPAGGGFRIENPNGADAGTWQRFNGGGRLVAEQAPSHSHDGSIGLGHLELGYADGLGHTAGPNGRAQWNLRVEPGGGLRLTDPRDNLSWRNYSPTRNLTAVSRPIAEHGGVDLGGVDLGHVEIDYAGNQATIESTAHGHLEGTYADNAGGFTLTHGANGWLSFSADGHLLAEHLDLHNLDGSASGTHLEADYANPAGPGFTAHMLTGPSPDFAVARNAGGHFTATDTRVGPGLGDFTVYDRFTGSVRGEQVNLLDHSGTHVFVDHTGAAPAYGLHGGDGQLGHFTVTRNPANGDLVVTDTRGAHAGDTRTFGADGRPLAEHISILTPGGRRTGESFEVDFTAGTWTRDGAAGPRPPAPAGAASRPTYSGAGAVVRKNDGTLILTGTDKTPVYQRETLDIGQSLELMRKPNGTRYWSTWDNRGLTDHGVRKFSTEADGVTSWDVGTWGRTIREYRTAIDGGVIRAEKLPDGSIRWTRFNKAGDRTLTGPRTTTLSGWQDNVTIGGHTHVVQQKWHAYNPLGHAKHYREYGVQFNAATGGYEVKAAYKEISPQAKDTNSKEILGNGHTLTVTRYAEQRPPDFLWKAPENLDGTVSKLLAKSFLGRKYAGIDFTHEGAVLGDSRFQVFTWVEHDAVGGAQASHGVRVVTPDGSTTDFTGDGILVRAVIKLDNGHTVEVGRDGAGKWAGFTLGAGGVRPGNTLDWRELDPGKNVVAQGTRTFTGKHWTDTYTDPVTGAAYVVRHTDVNGDVAHYPGANKPAHDPAAPPGGQVRFTGNEISITRNNMGQIVRRTDTWGGVGGVRPTVHVTGMGDARAGRWKWQSSDGGSGFRLSQRNERWTGSWDDSYADFRTNWAGETVQVHDLRALDKGKTLKAEPAGVGPHSPWHSAKFDASGDQIANSGATRTWKQADGGFGVARPPGAGAVPWRDTDAAGTVLRELIDGRVREYPHATDHGVWKEYDQGGVWRERGPAPGADGLYLEKEAFQKQWRMTTTTGVLVRFRSPAGHVWDKNAVGRWRMVGTEREDKGPLTAFRGWNRRIRESNRLDFKVTDGVAGTVKGTGEKLAHKVIADMAQEFVFDVVANIVITGAANNWNFSGADWGRIFTGGAIKSSVKGGYAVLSETALKGLRDGLRNVDGGKDFNRNPYNHDKYWDNEWAGNENPQRWRAGTYDYLVGTVAVSAVGNFISSSVTAAAFGVGKNHDHLTGLLALEAGGLGMAGNLVGNLSFGAAKTIAHQLSSGRLFHYGGIPDLALTLGEKFFQQYLVNDLLLTAANLKPKPPAPQTVGLAPDQPGTAPNP